MQEQELDILREAYQEIVTKKRRISQGRIAAEIGMNASALSRFITKKRNDKPSEVQQAKLIKLFKELGYSGTLPEPPVILPDDDLMLSEYFAVPIREAGGGMGGGYANRSRAVISHISLRRDFLARFGAPLDKLSFVHARGTSMAPTIPEKAAVLIDESQTCDPVNNGIYYILFDGDFLIKRLEVQAGRVIAIISDNGHVRQEIGVDQEFQILGRCLLQQSELV